MTNILMNFLVQTTRILYVGQIDDEELNMIYNFLTSVDNEVLNDYNNTCTILTYNNDLELYIEVLEAAIRIFEDTEEYEKCNKLKIKLDESKIIINKTTI
jgi:transcription initiation factor TFIIIB Brf1 subunit/transcription initiation factor TFIIB